MVNASDKFKVVRKSNMMKYIRRVLDGGEVEFESGKLAIRDGKIYAGTLRLVLVEDDLYMEEHEKWFNWELAKRDGKPYDENWRPQEAVIPL
jgi:hypothetical protein